MKKTVGSTDKVIRFILCAALVAVGLFAPVGQIVKIIAFVLAAIMFVTAFTGFCPLYSLLGISTIKKKE